MGTKSILAISLIAVLLVGVISFDDAYAAEKITVCHDEKTKNIKDKDLQKHLDHGDTEGACPNPLDAILEMIAELWDAIAGLQAHIDAIELLPGEKGETGETGPQGETGPAVDVSELEARITALENTDFENRIRDLEKFHFTIPGPASISNAILENGKITITIHPTINDGGKPILDYIVELNGMIVEDGISPDTTIVIDGSVGTLRSKAVNIMGEGPFSVTWGCC